MTKTLRPCPFCSGPAWRETLITPDQDYVRFGCRRDNCDVRPNSGWHEMSEEEEALAVWNSRSEYEETCIGVGDGDGDLFVWGKYEAVKRVQEMVTSIEALVAEVEKLKVNDQ